MARRTPRKLVALSASAIAAIYMAGYVATSGADAALNATPIPETTGGVVAAAAASPTSPALVPTPTTALGSTSQRAAAPVATATVASGYKDGTYTGSGDSRRGGVTVAVTVQGGRIANVKITDCWTEYPVSDISALPGQVVARQSAKIDRVTGASYSTQAFQQAVQQALAQAGSGSTAAAASSSAQSGTSAQTGPGPSIGISGRPGDALPGQSQPGQPQPRQRGGRGQRGYGYGYGG